MRTKKSLYVLFVILGILVSYFIFTRSSKLMHTHGSGRSFTDSSITSPRLEAHTFPNNNPAYASRDSTEAQEINGTVVVFGDDGQLTYAAKHVLGLSDEDLAEIQSSFTSFRATIADLARERATELETSESEQFPHMIGAYEIRPFYDVGKAAYARLSKELSSLLGSDKSTALLDALKDDGAFDSHAEGLYLGKDTVRVSFYDQATFLQEQGIKPPPGDNVHVSIEEFAPDGSLLNNTGMPLQTFIRFYGSFFNIVASGHPE